MNLSDILIEKDVVIKAKELVVEHSEIIIDLLKDLESLEKGKFNTYSETYTTDTMDSEIIYDVYQERRLVAENLDRKSMAEIIKEIVEE